MIKNDQQLSVARRKYEQAMDAAKEARDLESQQVLEGLAGTVLAEIEEYEGIRTGRYTAFKMDGMHHLGEALVKCRLAKGFTQAALAQELGVKEQQVQRYESRDYEAAALWRLAEVVEALGFRFRATLEPHARSRVTGMSVAIGPSREAVDLMSMHRTLPLVAPSEAVQVAGGAAVCGWR